MFFYNSVGLTIIFCTNNCRKNEGCGGGVVVSSLAFYSHDPSLNPAGYELSVLYYQMTIEMKNMPRLACFLYLE